MPNKILVDGWRPISEYSRSKYSWVLVKCYDHDNHMYLIPQMATLLKDGRWIGHDGYLIYEPHYFFDTDQLDCL